jgi:acyl carrier protein
MQALGCFYGHEVEVISVAENIEEKVIDIVSEQMGVDKSEITRETSFVNDLNADSLDTVELVMEFEDQFDLSIPDDEAEKIQTVGQAIDYIGEHLS